MMNAVNYVVRHIDDFEERVWPEARQKNVGLVAMKVLGGMYQSEDAPPYQPKANRGANSGRAVRAGVPLCLRFAGCHHRGVGLL